MKSSSSREKGASRSLALLLGLMLLGCWLLQGCATEAEGVQPWATPHPGEGSIPLPSSMMRQ